MELVNQRTENSKTFALGNGKKRLIAYKRIDPTWQIVASTDDCYRSKGPANEWALTTGTCQAGYQSSDYRQYGAGLRFTNITIPKGAIIDQAYLTFRSRLNKSAGPCRTRISAENVDNAPTFIDDCWVFDDRYANNTATVDWDNIPAWTTGEDYTSPDIKTVIQAIINRAGWVSGNAIVIFWEDFEYRSTVLEARRSAHSWDTEQANAPKLLITYTVPEEDRKTCAFPKARHRIKMGS